MAVALVSTLDLDWLFSTPSRFPSSPLCPPTLPGHTADDSVQTLRTVLKINSQNHHIFINELGFHKSPCSHMLHHLFAKEPTQIYCGPSTNMIEQWCFQRSLLQVVSPQRAISAISVTPNTTNPIMPSSHHGCRRKVSLIVYIYSTPERPTMMTNMEITS
jgi:hypothetical protein